MRKVVDFASFAALAAGFTAIILYGNGLVGFPLIGIAVMLFAGTNDITVEDDEEDLWEEGERDLTRRFQFYDDDNYYDDVM